MKVSVSLPDDDVAFLDECVLSQGLGSRSAAVQKAVRMMRAAELVDAYAEAFDEWADSDDAGLWDTVASDGISAN
jgi:antitoxin MazE9